jgi:hypothetical protein
MRVGRHFWPSELDLGLSLSDLGNEVDVLGCQANGDIPAVSPGGSTDGTLVTEHSKHPDLLHLPSPT